MYYLEPTYQEAINASIIVETHKMRTPLKQVFELSLGAGQTKHLPKGLLEESHMKTCRIN